MSQSNVDRIGEYVGRWLDSLANDLPKVAADELGAAAFLDSCPERRVAFCARNDQNRTFEYEFTAPTEVEDHAHASAIPYYLQGAVSMEVPKTGGLVLWINPARVTYSLDRCHDEVEEILARTHNIKARRSIAEHADAKIAACNEALTSAFAAPISVVVDWDSFINSEKTGESNIDRIGEYGGRWVDSLANDLAKIAVDDIGRDAFVASNPSGRIVFAADEEQNPTAKYAFVPAGGADGGAGPSDTMAAPAYLVGTHVAEVIDRADCLLISRNPARSTYSLDNSDASVLEILNQTHFVAAIRSIREHYDPARAEAENALMAAFGEPIAINTVWDSFLHSEKLSESNRDRIGEYMGRRMERIGADFVKLAESVAAKEAVMASIPGRTINLVADPDQNPTHKYKFEAGAFAPIEPSPHVGTYLRAMPIATTGSLMVTCNVARLTYSLDNINAEIHEMLSRTHYVSAVESILEHAIPKKAEAEAKLAAAFGVPMGIVVDWGSLVESPRISDNNCDRIGEYVGRWIEALGNDLPSVGAKPIYRDAFNGACLSHVVVIAADDDQNPTHTYSFGAATDPTVTGVTWYSGRYLAAQPAPHAGSLVIKANAARVTYSLDHADTKVEELLN